VPPPPPLLPRWPRIWWALFPLLAVATVALLLGSFLPAPYAMLSPGSARPIAPLLKIDTAKTYDHPGELLFVTVSVNSPPNEPTYVGALWGWLAAGRDVFSTGTVTDGRSADEDARYQTVLMSDSQQAASYLALKHLGYSVTQSAAGVFLSQIVPDSPADGHLAAGDTVVEIDGNGVSSSNDFSAIVRQHRPGDTINVTVERPSNGRLDVAVKLGSQVDQTGKTVPYVGVYLETRLRYHLPFGVRIDTDKVGGPSAGLAFTLALIEQLSPEDITHGNKVAVTGTMQPDGKVGNVGGVKQKTLAVRAAGADYFLVPADEYKEATEHAGSHLKVISVSTLDEALKALSGLPAKPSR
jgi:PDZ domain-containing protein